MRLVDTSAWIEWPIASPVAAIVAGEDQADQVIAFTATCIVAALDTRIALRAADLCGAHRLATADAIMLATAMAHGADLLTCDRNFEGLTGVRFLPKSPA